MKKNGFTLVELITTFALSSVIIILLINVIVILKNLYANSNTKTELYVNQSNLSQALNSKINDDNLLSYSECSGNFCYDFTFKDNSTARLNVTNNKITFDKFVYKLDDKVKLGEAKLMIENTAIEADSDTNSLLIIQIPITCDKYPNIDFGINLVYPYDANTTQLKST